MECLRLFNNYRASLMSRKSLVGSIAIASLCIGAALGLRFRVLVLLPVIILEFAILTATGIARDHDGQWIVLANLAGVVCVQLGYISGILLRSLFSTALLDQPFQDRWLFTKR
jgi:predicted exporter